jgi:hypothetical protein
MNRTRGLGLVMGIAAMAGAGAWLGCSSDSTGAATTDGGAVDSSSADSGGGDAAADSGGDAGMQLTISCENYCTLVTTNCTGQNAEYSSPGKDTCMAMCANMTLGARPDTTHDTVACRQDIAAAAQGNPSTLCPQAGPTGGDVCGADHCAAWCALDIAKCGTIAFADAGACVTACTALPYDKAAGDVAQLTGNTMNCRIYHLEAAYANDGGLSATHCPHTGTPSLNMGGSAGPCQ